MFNPLVHLSEDLVRAMQCGNPWWGGHPVKLLPSVRSNLVASIHKRLQQELAPIVLVRGPRRSGKTTAQLQVIADLLNAGTLPTHILRVQCNDLPVMAKLEEPILRIVEWYEAAILKKTLNDAAHASEPTCLFFDEVQSLSHWAVQLKHLVDGSKTQVIVTGDSALGIEQERITLAGRITSIEVESSI